MVYEYKVVQVHDVVGPLMVRALEKQLNELALGSSQSNDRGRIKKFKKLGRK